MRFGKILPLYLVLVFVALPLAARGQSGGKEPNASGLNPGGLNNTEEITGKINYPIKTDVTLSWWHDMDSNMAANFKSMGDTPWGRGLQEKTGIKIQFISPPIGSANEQFNLIIASGELPDILSRGWSTYPGGPEKAIADGIILRHNEIFEKYAYHLSKYLKDHPDYDKMTKTDNGVYFQFPFIRGDKKLLLATGLMLRQDWLDELGLQVPETIDEWYTVLKAFKEVKLSPIPFTFEYTRYMRQISFVFAYDIMRAFYIGKDKKVHWGAMEDGYRDFLVTFAQWYREGLVDSDLPTQNEQQISAKITGNISGATFGASGSRMGTWTNSARFTNPQFKLVGAPVPVLKKGTESNIFFADNPVPGNGTAITTSCKYPALAARLLDWGYSEEGHLYHNFGIEGESYTMINGYPTYTDVILKNPKGWSVGQSLGAYALSQAAGPFVQDTRYLEQYTALQEQKDAIKLWTNNDITKSIVPPIMPTQEESQEFARIMNEINTYQAEMEIKFILGIENLSNWDNYVSTIKRMGIDRAIEIQNAALARYNAR
jgi:putative aldouronate transport system substrate-binding protein